MNEDGFLKIKTKIDNSEIDTDIKVLENKIKILEAKNKGLNAKKESYRPDMDLADELTSSAEKAKQKYLDIQKEMQKIEQNNKFNPTASSAWIKLNNQLPNVKAQYQLATQEAEKQANKVGKIAAQVDLLAAKQEENNIKIQHYKDKIESIKFNKSAETLNEVSKKLNNVKADTEQVSATTSRVQGNTNNIISRVGQWALAVFGVRTAYNTIQRAVGILSQYNKQLSADIAYIQYALAKILEPIIIGFINIIYKLLAYVNYLAQAWFNVNLFAGASAKSFVNAKNGLSGATKQAKELKKATQGFDEMNIVQDNSSTNNNTTGIATPAMDLSNIKDVKIPDWLVKFKEFCQPVIDFFNKIIEKYGPVAGGIIIVVGAIAGFYILKTIIGLIGKLGKATSGITVDFTGFFDQLGKAVKAIALLGGLALVINSLTGLIDTFSKSGMSLGDVAGLLGVVLGELVGTFILLAGAMQLLTPSWQSILGAIVILGGLALVLVTVTNLIDTFSKSGISLGDVIGVLATILVSVVALMTAVATIGPLMTAGLIPFAVVIVGICALLAVIAATLPTILEACSNFIIDIGPTVIEIIKTINECINNTIRVLGEILPPIIESLGKMFDNVFNRNC